MTTDKRIFAAVAELMNTVGVRHLRMADVARLAGVSRQTVVNRSGTRDELIEAFLRSTGQQQTDAIAAAVTSDDPGRELASVVSSILRATQRLPAFAPPLRADQVELVRARLPSLRREETARLAGLLAQRSDVPAERAVEAAEVFDRLFESYLLQPEPVEDTAAAGRTVATAVTAVLGLRSP